MDHRRGGGRSGGGAAAVQDPNPVESPPGGFTLFRPPVERGFEARGSDRTKPESARRLIRGQHLDYGVWVDRSVWSPSWSAQEGPDLNFVPEDGSDSAAAFTQAHAGSLPFQGMADAFVATTGRSQTNMHLEAREIRRINGNDFLCVELSGNFNLAPVRTLACFFSNDVESIAFVGFQKRDDFEKGRNELENLVAGIVLSPSPSDGWPEPPGLIGPGRRNDLPEPRRVDPDAGVDPPVLRERVEPVYPEEARRSRETGTAILEGVIGPEGCVEALKILKRTREPLLDAAALRAVRQWTYDPAMLNGKPVSVYLTITVNFQLH